MKENVVPMKNNPIKPFRYFALHKPFGYLSQFVTSHKKKKVLSDIFPFPDEVMPIGRLDEDSEGLLLLTNNGKMHQYLLAHHAEKEYWVLVEGEVNSAQLKQLNEGIDISHQSIVYTTKPAVVKILDEVNIVERYPRVRYHPYKKHTWLSITIKEGRFRQVRKMTAAIGCPTLRLIRVRIGNYTLPEINNIGMVVELTHEEVSQTGFKPLV
ncbi:MAG: pseudouridine synthase [Bacteroidota bacterium]|jgi:23S rRNA pseudouridine2457 synthase